MRKLAEVQVRGENSNKVDSYSIGLYMLYVVQLSHSGWYSDGTGWCTGVSCGWKYGTYM